MLASLERRVDIVVLTVEIGRPTWQEVDMHMRHRLARCRAVLEEHPSAEPISRKVDGGIEALERRRSPDSS